MDPLAQLARHRLVPVIVIDSAADAVPLAEALLAGGLPVIELTMRTPAAEAAIRAAAKIGNMLVGAGTILTIDMARRAMDAGASFIVTPGFGPKIVEFCVGQGIPILPGCANATDLQAAVGDFNLPVVKFFPAEAAGGLKTLKALHAPFPSVKFMPTGGITVDNLKGYLDFSPVLACGGSWMATRDMIAARQFDKIRQLAAESVELVRVRHVI